MNIMNYPPLPPPIPDNPMPGMLLVAPNEAVLLIGAILALACALLWLLSGSAQPTRQRRATRGRRERALLHRV